MKKVLKIALVAAILLPARVVFAADITVGANIGNVPWEFQDASGKFVGFEIDLVNEIGKRLGKSVEVVNIPFNGLFSAVQSGRIDIALSSITITEKRLNSVSFTQPYYDSAQSLTVLTRSNAGSLGDMSDKIVGVDTGSTGDMWTSANQDRYGFADIRRYEGLAPAMLDLQTGRIDGYISDIPSLEYFIKDKPFFKVVERIETGERYSMMLAKHSGLTDQANDVISELKQEGYLATLHRHWFGTDPSPASATVSIIEKPATR